MNKSLHSIFPTYVFQTELNFDNKILIDCIKNSETSTPRSIRNGVQTNRYLHKKYNIFNKINLDIHSVLNSCIDEILIPIKTNFKIKYETKEMWANILRSGGFNIEHNHPGYFMSGVFYANAPKNSGKIFFRDPRPVADWCGDSSLYHLLNSDYAIEPKDNMLLLFPSWLYHRVEQNNSEEDRISISFNIHKYI